MKWYMKGHPATVPKALAMIQALRDRVHQLEEELADANDELIDMENYIREAGEHHDLSAY